LRPADFKSAASADFAIRALSSSYPNQPRLPHRPQLSGLFSCLSQQQ
jgi:hypothetical protein